jgi:hypothetical protein
MDMEAESAQSKNKIVFVLRNIVPPGKQCRSCYPAQAIAKLVPDQEHREVVGREEGFWGCTYVAMAYSIHMLRTFHDRHI